MEISKMLTLSTGHIKKTSADLLDYFADEDDAIFPTTYKKKGYGWFILIPDDIDEYALPYDLSKVLEFAKRHSCDWLCLDRDGQEIEFLPQYAW